MKNRQEILREKTKTQYDDLLKVFTENDEYVVPFKTIVGEKFPAEPNTGIVFYGRCTNGWDGEDKKLADFFSARRPFLNLMYWIVYWYFEGNGYSYEKEWMDYAVFSNVVKMVPGDGGNCSNDMWRKQYDKMKEIIKIENEELSPKFTVLVLGNSVGLNGWENPFKELSFLSGNELYHIDWGKSSKGGRCSIYKQGNQYFILTDRPEGRRIEDHAEAIWQLIDKAKKGDFD